MDQLQLKLFIICDQNPLNKHHEIFFWFFLECWTMIKVWTSCDWNYLEWVIKFQLTFCITKFLFCFFPNRWTLIGVWIGCCNETIHCRRPKFSQHLHHKITFSGFYLFISWSLNWGRVCISCDWNYLEWVTKIRFKKVLEFKMPLSQPLLCLEGLKFQSFKILLEGLDFKDFVTLHKVFINNMKCFLVLCILCNVYI